MAKRTRYQKLSLEGLEIAPSQIWGAIRMVPLIRHNVREDLRLTPQKFKTQQTEVSLNGELTSDGLKYISYVPHAMVASWSNGTNVATWGTQMYTPKDGRHLRSASVNWLGRMAKRLSDNQLRFLPLHLAMEGYLSLYFGGPDTVWSEYSHKAISDGLNPRSEFVVSGRMINKLEEALRVFEIHEGQTGVLLFVADALASAFIVSHPDDYRKLHKTLIEDFYGDLLYQYSNIYKNVSTFVNKLSSTEINSLENIRKEVEKSRQALASFKEEMAKGVFDRLIQVEEVYKMGRFTLNRFIPELRLEEENHIGEFILSDTGSLEYLKTYHLSKQQTKRAYFLQQLALANWNLEVAATQIGLTYGQLIERIYKVGFGFLLHWPTVSSKISQIDKILRK